MQGVGFRPFLYQLARQHGLNGEVANTASGVGVVLEGPALSIERFVDDLSVKKPPLAVIVEVTRTPAPLHGFITFSIVKSRADATRATLISPDVMVCDDCLAEMRDPADRRFGYPFINCTNCGPRYTIIDDIPYDRPKTSMRHFTMCAACQAEYDDPANRRFHAQPNACPVCGPRVSLCDAKGRGLAVDDPIAEAIRRIRQGHIVAVKGLGGFHLAVDATNAEAVTRLRRRKHREEKPFALMCTIWMPFAHRPGGAGGRPSVAVDSAAHRPFAQAGGDGHCHRRCAGQSLVRYHAALCAAPSFVDGCRVRRPGHDQCQFA